MRLPLNARVSCTDGEGGTSTRIIVDPTARRATHVVVREQHRPHHERLVPVEVVRTAAPGRVELSCSRADLLALQPFRQDAFLDLAPDAVRLLFEELGLDGPDPGGWMLWPYVYPHVLHLRRDHPRVGKHDVAVRRGAAVEARDGRVGTVSAFVVDPNDDHITDLVVETRHVLSRHEAVLPLSLIDSWDETVVRLSVDRGTVAALPHVPLRRVGERPDDPVGDVEAPLEPPEAAGQAPG